MNMLRFAKDWLNLIYFSSVLSDSCSSSEGPETGWINTSDLSASSSFTTSVGASQGRLHGIEGGGAWCPLNMVNTVARSEAWEEC